MTVRTAAPEDAEVLAVISAASLSEKWNSRDFLSTMETTGGQVICAEEQDQIVGYAVFYHAADEAELTGIAVLPDRRRCGAGRLLMEEMIRCLKEMQIRKVFLEVRAANEPAHALYRKFGFLTVGVRPGFYSAPKEDADLMALAML